MLTSPLLTQWLRTRGTTKSTSRHEKEPRRPDAALENGHAYQLTGKEKAMDNGFDRYGQ